jgi:hypothetical protein
MNINELLSPFETIVDEIMKPIDIINDDIKKLNKGLKKHLKMFDLNFVYEVDFNHTLIYRNEILYVNGGGESFRLIECKLPIRVAMHPHLEQFTQALYKFLINIKLKDDSYLQIRK